MFDLSVVITIFYFGVLLNNNGFGIINAEESKPEKLVTFDGCKCGYLKCDCCTFVDIRNSTLYQVCLTTQIIPREFAFKGILSVNGKSIYTGQLGPGLVPLCVQPSVCISVNHVDLKKLEVCTKLSFAIFTILKFPCISQEGGRMKISKNTY